MSSQEEQQQQQSEEITEASSPAPPRRRGPPMPPDDMLRNSIARNLTQILVNMTNADGQQKCRELLQVNDLMHGAHIRILSHLEHIDERREQRECAARKHKPRKADKENQIT